MPQTFNVGSRSRFVNAVAWLFIALGLLAFGWAAIQNATQSSWGSGLSADRGLAGFLGRELHWVFSGAIVLSLAAVVCAVGLLRRLEWARRVFIGLLAVAIGVDLAGLWLQQELVHLLVDPALRGASLPQQLADLFGGMLVAARLLAGAITLVACAVLADIIRRLMTPGVRQEFA